MVRPKGFPHAHVIFSACQVKKRGRLMKKAGSLTVEDLTWLLSSKSASTD